MKKTLYSCFALLVSLFSGCQKHIEKQKRLAHDKQTKMYELQESIARLVDIPDVPLQCKIIAIAESEQGSSEFQLICDCALMLHADIISYYKEEMERIGWQLQSEYDREGEALLVFIKPGGSVCTVSLRDHQRVVITKMISKA